VKKLEITVCIEEIRITKEMEMDAKTTGTKHLNEKMEQLNREREASKIEGVTYKDMLEAMRALIKEGNKEQEEAIAKRFRGEIRIEVAKQTKQIGSNIASRVAKEQDNLREEIKDSVRKVEKIQREINQKHTEE
jgi:translation initiation factor 2B subunit (eIF-2B alpha/beta/delta family)